MSFTCVWSQEECRESRSRKAEVVPRHILTIAGKASHLDSAHAVLPSSVYIQPSPPENNQHIRRLNEYTHGKQSALLVSAKK